MKQKSTIQQDSQPIYQRIQRKREILARIEAIRLELSGLTTRKERLESERVSTRNEAIGINDERIEKFPAERARKQELLNKAEQLKVDSANVSTTIDALKSELQSLKDVELPGCIETTGLDEVLAHQVRAKALHADVKRLEDAIAAQRQIIDAAKASVQQIPDRSSERAAMLADIAIGDAKPADLDKIDRQTAAEQQAHEASQAQAAPVIQQATQTIAGLEAKIADLTSKLAALEAEDPLILEQYLMSQINALGEQFARDALALKEAFIQLCGLEELLHSATASKHQIMPFNLTLPLPRLAVAKRIWPNSYPDLLFTTRSPEAVQERAAWVVAERKRLAGEGCEIL